MSGPVSEADAPEGPTGSDEPPDGPQVELLEARTAEVGGLEVRRALPKRAHRTVGAWCFADLFGPAEVADGMQIGPHPHIGLQTVTWLVEGEVVHHDSLGSEQPIRPGQLNLMSAGHGIAHAEESPRRGVERVHGAQLWVAQPEATRHGEAAFEHHAELPQVDLGDGAATVLVGELAGARSPARTDTPLVGAELQVHADTAPLGLEPTFEHAVVVLDGAVAVDGAEVGPGTLAYLGLGRSEVEVRAVPGSTTVARALLLGGEPFEAELAMWWNFVARTRAEVDQARADWRDGSERFGPVTSALARIPAPD